MIKVRNGKVVSRLARRCMAANRTRNIVAVIAIVLTTLLFTALFTVAGTLASSLQQQTFRQLGGDMHGTFKNISWEQVEALRSDGRIVSSGARLIVGMPEDAPFNKTHTEISYMDAVCARGYFCSPTTGALPEENTDEIACDTRVLSLLGVEPKLGETITLKYTVGSGTGNDMTVTDSFTLSGFWEFDEASQASMAIVPRSYAEKILSGYRNAGADPADTTGTWDLNVYLKSAAHIEDDMEAILADFGYQNTDASAGNYIDTGVNWAYIGAQISSRADPATAAAIAALLILIVLTGYLIIYNIFQISVANDIRLYGLLKTIGTTARQLRRVIRRQALALCVVGIPLGLLLGWLVGSALCPAVLAILNTYQAEKASANPLIFLGAAAFSLFTVLISCLKPGRMAGKVSPVEAVRWTEGETAKAPKKSRRSRRVTPRTMALANLSRSKGRTALVVLSLSLAVVLLEATCSVANGFDMDKYLDKFVVSDYILGSAGYFQHNGLEPISEEAVESVDAQEGITDSGRVYGAGASAEEFVSEERFREHYGRYNDAESVDAVTRNAERGADGSLADAVNLYGMEDYPLSKLKVIDGSLDEFDDVTRNSIAAVLNTDDYGKPIASSNWARVGDSVTIRYVEEYGYYDIVTGEPTDPAKSENGYYVRAVKYHDVTYTVEAVVTMRTSMSYRFFGNDAFVLPAEAFKNETGVEAPMTYLLDVEDGAKPAMESFLKNYTTQVDPSLDYESKSSYTSEFTGTRDMFLLMGGALSAVIGLVGVLNFLNAMLTSIISRRRELAILQATGMTNAQLRAMLVWEGASYAILTLAFSTVLCLAAAPLMKGALEGALWFFTWHFSLLPIAICAPILIAVSVLTPLLCVRASARQSVVERLAKAE